MPYTPEQRRNLLHAYLRMMYSCWVERDFLTAFAVERLGALPLEAEIDVAALVAEGRLEHRAPTEYRLADEYTMDRARAAHKLLRAESLWGDPSDGWGDL